MRKTLQIVACMLLGCSLLPLAAAQNTPVVVELFTSEGCSSCPPADALFTEYSRKNPFPGVDLILLGEHVDYWNQLGWKDRFSSAQYTQRQGDYAKQFHLASVYTPQMVIDGQTQYVGDDPTMVKRDIEAAAAKDPMAAQVTMEWQGKNRLHITVQSPNAPHAKLLLAVTEDGLSTTVDKGENGGKTLHHAAVVRELREVATVDKPKFEKSTDVSAQKDWNPAQLKVAVLVQDPAGRSSALPRFLTALRGRGKVAAGVCDCVDDDSCFCANERLNQNVKREYEAQLGTFSPCACRRLVVCYTNNINRSNSGQPDPIPATAWRTICRQRHEQRHRHHDDDGGGSSRRVSNTRTKADMSNNNMKNDASVERRRKSSPS